MNTRHSVHLFDYLCSVYNKYNGKRREGGGKDRFWGWVDGVCVCVCVCVCVRESERESVCVCVCV